MSRLLAVVVALLIGGTVTTAASGVMVTYDASAITHIDVRDVGAAKGGPGHALDAQEQSVSSSVEGLGTSTTPHPRVVATNTVDDVFHYTKGEFVDSISTNGLRPGSYATPSGGLSPLQAQIDLALPPNTGLRDAVMRVDVAGLREAGYEIPAITRVTGTVTGPGGRVYTMPGGGYEMQFPYAIPPEFIKVVTP